MKNKSIKIIASFLALSLVMNLGLIYKSNEHGRKVQDLYDLLVLTQGIVVSLQNTNNYCTEVSLRLSGLGKMADLVIVKQKLTTDMFGDKVCELADAIDANLHEEALLENKKNIHEN